MTEKLETRTNQTVKVLPHGGTLEGVDVKNIREEEGWKFGYCEISGSPRRVILTSDGTWHYYR